MDNNLTLPHQRIPPYETNSTNKSALRSQPTQPVCETFTKIASEGTLGIGDYHAIHSLRGYANFLDLTREISDGGTDSMSSGGLYVFVCMRGYICKLCSCSVCGF